MTGNSRKASALLCYCQNAASFMDTGELTKFIEMSFTAEELNKARKELSTLYDPADSAPKNLTAAAKRTIALASKDLAEAFSISPPTGTLHMDALTIGNLPGMSRTTLKGAANVAAAVTRSITDTIIENSKNVSATNTAPQPSQAQSPTQPNQKQKQAQPKPAQQKPPQPKPAKLPGQTNASRPNKPKTPKVNSFAQVVKKKVRRKGPLTGTWDKEGFQCQNSVKEFRIWIGAYDRECSVEDIRAWSDMWELEKINNVPLIEITHIVCKPRFNAFCAEFKSRTTAYLKAIPNGIKFSHYESKAKPVSYDKKKTGVRLYLSQVCPSVAVDDVKKALEHGFTNMNPDETKIIELEQPGKSQKPIESKRYYCTMRSKEVNTRIVPNGNLVPFNVQHWRGKPPRQVSNVVKPDEYKDLSKITQKFKMITNVDHSWTSANKFSVLGTTSEGSGESSGGGPGNSVFSITAPKSNGQTPPK